MQRVKRGKKAMLDHLVSQGKRGSKGPMEVLVPKVILAGRGFQVP